MTNTEKPQPMEVDQKKPEEKPEEKQELVSLLFVESLLSNFQFLTEIRPFNSPIET
jgi:hypothetical protein